MGSIPKQFSIRILFAATALWAIYCASLPQLLEGRDPPIAHFVISCLAGALVARGTGYRSLFAYALGGGVGSAIGTGAPTLFLLLFPHLHNYDRWGGYGFTLDFAVWFLVTIMMFAAGGLFTLVGASLAQHFFRRWRANRK